MVDETTTSQMSLLCDTDEVIKFLEVAEKKLILSEHTVNCRLTACNHIFSILNKGEDTVDYMLNNLEILISRFRNKNVTVQASTIKVYKSRLKSSLEDYKAWCKDPVAWEKSVLERTSLARGREKKSKIASSSRKATSCPDNNQKSDSSLEGSVAAKRQNNSCSMRSNGRTVVFPVRPDFNLEMTLPQDGLSMRELLKLGLFLYPYCKESQDPRSEEQPIWATPNIAN